MEKKEKYYKEIIKSRMFRNAASMWGVRNIDNFDPLVKLMIEALASEINKLSHELNNIEIRLLERLAILLTPDTLLRDQPAHMILYAQPTDEKTVLDKMSGFFHEGFKKNNSLSFYPVGQYNLTKANVRSLICGRSLYLFDQSLSKDLLAKSIRKSEMFTHAIWIGIDIPPYMKSLKKGSFYFDIQNIENKNELLHLLPYAQWEQNGKPLNTSPGMYRTGNMEEKRSKPFENYDLSNISDNCIINNYNHHFVTVIGEISNHPNDRKKIPEEVKELFPSDIIEESMEPLIWIKVSFPPNYDEYILDNFFVTLNAFPVANKKLHSKYFKTNSTITSVIPLETNPDEHFLAIKSVFDNQQEYMSLPYLNAESSHHKTYIVKKGGIERFDPRDAKEHISYLVDLLREENSAFAMIGKGFVDELVQKMEELIVSIEKKLKDIHANKDISSYLIIDATELDETIFVDYWVTNCEQGNDIKAGSTMFPLNTTDVEPDTVISLTQSKGGRHINRHRSLDTYKYILTSRDSIYTDEDIVNFCFSEFGDILSKAKVKKGVAVSSKPKEGLIRTIDVFISVREQMVQLSSNEDIHHSLLRGLKERSPESYNYRVFITQP